MFKRFMWMIPSLCAVLGISGIAQARVVYSNDFEKGAGENPAGWHTYMTPNSEGSFEWRNDPDQARSGSRALWLENRGPMTTLWQTGIPVVGGAAYTISVWANVEEGRGTTFIGVRCRDADGKWISGTLLDSKMQDVFLQGHTGWQEMVYHVRVPASAATLQIFLANRNGEGDQVWFDDLKVEEAVVETFEHTAPGLIASLEQEVSDPDLASRTDAYLEQLRPLRDVVATAETLSVGKRRELWSVLIEGIRLQQEVERARFIADLREQTGVVGAVWVDSMRKVFIDDVPIEGEVSETGRIEMFPGEQEAIQWVLVPMRDVEAVTVRVTPGGEAARLLEPGDVTWRAVGYVKIEAPARNHYRDEPFPYVGWWPDPLLPVERLPLEAGTFQPIWIQVDLPRSVRPGEYPLTVEAVDADGQVLAESELVIQVLAGELPKRWHMKKVLSFSDRIARDSLAGWTSKPGGVVHYGKRWEEVAPRYHEMLLDYRIGIGSWYDRIYTYSPELIQWARDRGQNLFFASIGMLARYNDRGEIAVRPQDMNDVLNQVIPFLKQHDLLDISWVFAFDEQWPDAFDVATDAFARIKKAGDVTTASTLKDFSYGTETALGDVVDVFIPSIHRNFDSSLAREARAMGNEVAWYSTRDFNIETDAIYHRLIPWRTMAVGSEGYLIWAMNRWVGNDEFLDDEIRSSWNPQLDGVTPSSSAMMVYPGEDGPIASIRLENFRDGVEDYDLMMELALRRYPSKEPVEAGMQLLSDLGVSAAALMSSEQIREVRRKLSQMQTR